MKRRMDPERAARMAEGRAQLERESDARVAAWLAWRACPIMVTPMVDWTTPPASVPEHDRLAIIRTIAPTAGSATVADLEAVIYMTAARAEAQRLGHYGPNGRTLERKLDEPRLLDGDKWRMSPADRADWEARHPVTPQPSGPWSPEDEITGWGNAYGD